MSQNAYFQLNNGVDGLYLIMHPPLDGGRELSFAEVTLYLAKIKAGTIDRNKIKYALDIQTRKKEIKISDECIPPVNEELIVKISGDRMKAHVKCYAPSREGKLLGKSDFLKKMADAGIKHGIIDNAVDEWLEGRPYCTDVLVAEGTAVEQSKDAVLEYKFNTNKEFNPETDDKGSIDFHRLNLINHVSAGDVLAVLSPAHEGKHGMNVLGIDIPSAKPLILTLDNVDNAQLSEDGCVLTSKVSGHVELVGRNIVINNIYAVNGDVGTATGDIEYDGTVKISGDVRAGYRVKATGDIFVNGIVEAASLSAGGQIILTNGMHGDAKGSLNADGDIIAKFIQGSTVVSKGSVTSGSIIHSRVTAYDSIIVNSQKGVILGGETKARALISANVIGSEIGMNTLIEVGSNPAGMAEYHSLEKLLIEKRAEQRKIHQIANFIKKKAESGEQLPPDKAALAASIPHQVMMIDTELMELMKRYEQLKEDIEFSDRGRVVVKGAIYKGTKVVISNVAYYVHDAVSFCQFVKEGMEVRVYSI